MQNDSRKCVMNPKFFFFLIGVRRVNKCKNVFRFMISIIYITLSLYLYFILHSLMMHHVWIAQLFAHSLCY